MANFCPRNEDICISRGDSPVMFVTITDDLEVIQDITGFTFNLTVGPSPAPVNDTNQLFQLSGVIVDGPGGRVRFQPSTLNTDLSPGVFFYDVQMVTLAPSVRTVLSGKFQVKQDITKI
ncbi:MAG: hypothetical protein ACR2QF_06165 [Geminicoccaceae bacterium]